MIHSAGSDCRLIFNFWDGRINLCENSDHHRPGLCVGLVDQLVNLVTHQASCSCFLDQTPSVPRMNGLIPCVNLMTTYSQGLVGQKKLCLTGPPLQFTWRLLTKP